MSVTLGDAILYLRSDNSKLDKGIKDAEGGVMGIVGKLGGLFAVGAGAALSGVVAVGGAAFLAGQQLDEATDKLAIRTGKTGEELQALSGEMKNVFSSIPTDANSAAAAIGGLNANLGMTGKPLEDMSKGLIQATKLLGGDVATNTQLASRLMGDWSIKNEDGAATMDKVFVAAQKSGIGFDTLMSKVVQFGSPLRLMGFSLDESVAMLAKWEKEGVNSELVLGSLRIAAGKFAGEGKPLKESLQQTFDAIKNNTDQTAALAIGMDVFGARAGPDMVAAIREGRFNIEDLTKALQGADGAIDQTAKSTEDFPEKLERLKNKAVVALEPLGGKILDLASNVIDKLTPAFETAIGFLTTTVIPVVTNLFDLFSKGIETGDFTAFWSALFGPETGKQIQDITTTVIGFVTGTLIPFIQDHLPELQAALVGIGAALAAAAIVSTIASIVALVASLANPIGLIIVAAGLLAAAWSGNWGGIQDKTQAVIAWISTNFGWLIDGLVKTFNWWKEQIGMVLEFVKLLFSGKFEEAGAQLRQIWDRIWNSLKEVVDNAWKKIQEIDWLELGLNIIRGIANGVSSASQWLYNAVSDVLQGALDFARGFLGIQSPSKVAADKIGEPTGEGVGIGWIKGLNKIRSRLVEGITNISGSISSNLSLPQPLFVNVEYKPLVSTADRDEAQSVLTPIIRNAIR